MTTIKKVFGCLLYWLWIAGAAYAGFMILKEMLAY